MRQKCARIGVVFELVDTGAERSGGRPGHRGALRPSLAGMSLSSNTTPDFDQLRRGDAPAPSPRSHRARGATAPAGPPSPRGHRTRGAVAAAQPSAIQSRHCGLATHRPVPAMILSPSRTPRTANCTDSHRSRPRREAPRACPSPRCRRPAPRRSCRRS